MPGYRVVPTMDRANGSPEAVRVHLPGQGPLPDHHDTWYNRKPEPGGPSGSSPDAWYEVAEPGPFSDPLIPGDTRYIDPPC